MSPTPKRKILLLSYTFPPTPGIGGRRWAKFCKFLTKENIEFHVIHSNKSSYGGDFWRNDVENNPNIITYPISFKFNSILSNPNANIFQKILRRILMLWIRGSKFNPFDSTSFSKKRVNKLSKKIIKEEKIETVIITGPPYNILHYGVELKKENDVKLVVDYRDMWNGHPWEYKFQNTTLKQQGYALQQEKEILKSADAVFSVNAGLSRHLLKLNGEREADKFHVIYNGFDKNDFYLNVPKQKSDKIRMFFAGNIANDSFELVMDFVNSFKSLKINNPSLYSKFEFTICCHTTQKEFVTFLEGNVDENFIFINKLLPRDDYYKTLRSIDIGVVFLTEVYKDAFITKFSDFVLNENFIVQIGFKGDFSFYLKKHQIGKTYHLNKGYRFFEEIANANLDYSHYQDNGFDLEIVSEQVNDILLNLNLK